MYQLWLYQLWLCQLWLCQLWLYYTRVFDTCSILESSGPSHPRSVPAQVACQRELFTLAWLPGARVAVMSLGDTHTRPCARRGRRPRFLFRAMRRPESV